MKFLSGKHSSYLLCYHIVFVCKYRRPFLIIPNLSAVTIQLICEICMKHNVSVIECNDDDNHMHILISAPPTINLANLISTIKSYTTYHCWKKFGNTLRKYLWKEKTLWSDGYFATTVGDNSIDKVVEYIQNQ